MDYLLAEVERQRDEIEFLRSVLYGRLGLVPGGEGEPPQFEKIKGRVPLSQMLAQLTHKTRRM